MVMMRRSWFSLWRKPINKVIFSRMILRQRSRGVLPHGTSFGRCKLCCYMKPPQAVSHVIDDVHVQPDSSKFRFGRLMLYRQFQCIPEQKSLSSYNKYTERHS